MLVKMVDTDPRSTTCQNLRYLRRVTSLEHPELYSSWRIREELPSKCVPDGEKWRLGLSKNDGESIYIFNCGTFEMFE